MILMVKHGELYWLKYLDIKIKNFIDWNTNI